MRKDTVKQEHNKNTQCKKRGQKHRQGCVYWPVRPKKPPKNRVIPVTVMIYYIYGEPWSS